VTLDDILQHRAGVVPYAVFSGACAAAGALVFEKSRPYALLIGLGGGLLGALAESMRETPQTPRPRQVQVHAAPTAPASHAHVAHDAHDAALNVLQLLAAQEAGHVPPNAVFPALKAFQALSGLQVTGMPDAQTMTALLHAARTH